MENLHQRLANVNDLILTQKRLEQALESQKDDLGYLHSQNHELRVELLRKDETIKDL